MPDVDDLRLGCLSLHPDTPFAGRVGRDHTMQLVQQSSWWPGIDRDVQQYASPCDHCQRNKSFHGRDTGLLQSLPVVHFAPAW